MKSASNLENAEARLARAPAQRAYPIRSRYAFDADWTPRIDVWLLNEATVEGVAVGVGDSRVVGIGALADSCLIALYCFG